VNVKIDPKALNSVAENMSHHALENWEMSFALAIQKIAPQHRNKAGILLPVVPNLSQWDDYLSSVRMEWQQDWKRIIDQCPGCVLLLYAGLAFYKYDDNTFWPQFSLAIGTDPLPVNQQQAINSAFAKAAEYFGLKLKLRDRGTDFVGTAIHYIGIPLSLWDGFLDICEWTLWRKDWETLSDEEWGQVVEKRSGSRRRLKKFLLGNRATASSFVQEMLDAREILMTDASLPISSIAQASILRIEYFDEVPETAEFLRPQNPESLFQDRARLMWNEQRRRISLYLPAVKQEKLPLNWRIGTDARKASTTPDELLLDSKAFHNPLLLMLESKKQSEVQRLQGLEPWGLFDLESGGRQVVNPDRDELPLKNYLLVSQTKIDVLSREEFDEEGNPLNEPFELSDGTICFVTRLWPTGKYAELCLREKDGNTKTIRFRTKAKIEARFFAGKEEQAAYFSRIQDRVKIEQWPVLCVSIPRGYFRDNKTELEERFNVFIDDKLADGQWKSATMQDNDKEFYFWEWSSSRPVLELVNKSSVAKNFQELNKFCRFPTLRGERLLSIRSPEFTVPYKIYKDEPKHGMGKCWKNLPGAFLPWFLLCQSSEGMKWDDLMLAKDVIAPNLRISYSLLRKYEDQGMLLQRGRKWEIRESRATLRSLSGDGCQMEYCGDPSILWGLYRRMYHERPNCDLPIIEIIDKRGWIPYLQIIWHSSLRSALERCLRNYKVVISRQLWTH